MLPSQRGELLPAVATGLEFIVTVVVETSEHPPAVTVNVYVPPPAVVMEEMDGFCNEEVNPFGPDQE